MKHNILKFNFKLLFTALILLGLCLEFAWTPFTDGVFIKDAEAVIGRPATPGSVAGVARRTSRRTTRRVYRRHAIVGHRVTVLPVGYTTVVVAGVTYYHHANVYYRPYYEGNTVVYVVVENPNP